MQQYTLFTAVAHRPHPVLCSILEDYHYTTGEYWATVIIMNVYINAREKSNVQINMEDTAQSGIREGF